MPESRAKLKRCAWAEHDPLLRDYHDDEWGVPQYDSKMLWETLILDLFQAGLSWKTVLQKREGLRKAFRKFHPRLVARFREADIARLLRDPSIIRSRAKVEAAIANARAYLAMEAAGEDFSAFVWTMAGGSPIRSAGKIPSKTELSENISAALKARGFKFIGPVTVYAWMQAAGIVNDHSRHCFRKGGRR